MDIINKFTISSKKKLKNLKSFNIPCYIINWDFHKGFEVYKVVSKEELYYYRSYATDLGSKSYFGYATPRQLQQFGESLNKLLKKNYNIIEKYCEGREECYIHVSLDENLNLEEKDVNNYYLQSLNTFNPVGLWYSCGTAWLDYYFQGWNRIEHHFKLNKKLKKQFFSYQWCPFNVYILNLSNLNIKKISTCRELKKFSSAYKNKNADENRYLSLKKLKKDFDGLQICPYLALKCSNFLREYYRKYFETDISNIKSTSELSPSIDWLFVLSMALNGKIKQSDKDILWNVHWETASGVILKNFSKVIITKLI